MQDLLSHLSWLDRQQQPMLALIEELANMNSGTFNHSGVRDVRDKLVQEFESLGGQLELVPGDPWQSIDELGHDVTQTSESSIHIRKRPNASKKVMLCIHMDTVFGVEHAFQKCQFLENGHLNGPGVVDAKGGLVIMLHALRTLERSPLAERLGWEVIINPDEEIGSPSSSRLIAERAASCDFGMLFEPSLPDGTMVSWRKGSGNFTFVARGVAAHAGRDFSSGRNAIVGLSKLMVGIDSLNTNADTTYNVGKIDGGGPLNMVPDLAIGGVNVRVKTTEQQLAAQEKLAELVLQMNHQLDGVSVEMHGHFSSPPKPLDEAADSLIKTIETCGEALAIPVQWQGTGGACDGNKFAAAGLPNIDTFGPCGGNLHRTDEYLIPSSLVPRTKLAALVLLKTAAS